MSLEREAPRSVAMEWVEGKGFGTRAHPRVDGNLLSAAAAETCRTFHRTLPSYSITPLHGLVGLGRSLGLKAVWIKDEANRFGLKSFKALGATWALFRLLNKRLGRKGNERLDFRELAGQDARSKLGRLTFATATDGNHGKGVAWSARLLGHKAAIYMPENSAGARIAAIERLGARVVIVPGNYDDAVRRAARDAAERGWIVVSDTSWDGYREIPTWVMQGYLTLFAETADQLEAAGVPRLAAVFLQGGVGSLAAAGVGYLSKRYADRAPLFVLVEPVKAACLLESGRTGALRPVGVTGDLSTIMAGLACGEPNPLAWQILCERVHAYVSIPDFMAAHAMRRLARPMEGDPAVVSGESGAAGLAGLIAVRRLEPFRQLWERLNLTQNDHVLCVNTEGDTDPYGYNAIVNENALAEPSLYREALNTGQRTS
ncbi:MAG: diaminopropionate ammonia-lyase [Deltaproteobacteria bacterium]|nr:diaminopropionate ammonia-lyase [Deltaproteobacteria bacterium]